LAPDQQHELERLINQESENESKTSTLNDTDTQSDEDCIDVTTPSAAALTLSQTSPISAPIILSAPMSLAFSQLLGMGYQPQF
jgi:hypothetical protein